ncbi:ribonuclease P protein component [Candidatus Sumerlaeota bacterium]|nr:ribonuclease P protein component [Candidatus Sumerlaeota bacterium]
MVDSAELGPQGQSGGVQLKFGRNRRLLKRREFEAVYEAGRKARGRFVTTFCLRRSGEQSELPFRLGLTVSRKCGSAVRRNRQRRRLREFFRVRQHQIPAGWDFVVNGTPGLDELPRRKLEKDMIFCLGKLGFQLVSIEHDR